MVSKVLQSILIDQVRLMSKSHRRLILTNLVNFEIRAVVLIVHFVLLFEVTRLYDLIRTLIDLSVLLLACQNSAIKKCFVLRLVTKHAIVAHDSLLEVVVTLVCKIKTRCFILHF